MRRLGGVGGGLARAWLLVVLVPLLGDLRASAAAPQRLAASSLSPLRGTITDVGRADPNRRHSAVVGLVPRNPEALEAFLADVQDPSSPRYRQFLTQDEFNALYAPTEAAEQAVVAHLEASGLRVTQRFSNRLLVGATGNVGATERAFGVEIHDLLLGGTRHYSALDEPWLPADIAPLVSGVLGLDDLVAMRARPRARAVPLAVIGTNCCHLGPPDVATFYGNRPELDGSGETVAIAGVYAWRESDNTTFNARWGLPPLPAGSGQVCTGQSTASGCQFSTASSLEIALDVEYVHGTAPGARILNYMAASTSLADFPPMYNRIVLDNPGHIVSTSWGGCEINTSSAAQHMADNIFANGNAIGQSWFAASGDDGSRDCRRRLNVDHPANSPHVMGVGGTTPTCSGGLTPSNPACLGYGSERGWSGSGGGLSRVFARPAFQVGCGVPAGTLRLVPDVALEADLAPGNFVFEAGQWWVVGGTSLGAPQWAGFLAELHGRTGGAGFGNPGARLYSLCRTPAFHDITVGSNGDYSAAAGYDLVTGLGTIDADEFFARTLPTTTTTTLPPVCRLDLDGDGIASVATDVVYLSRGLLGLTPVPPSFRTGGAVIPPDSVIADRISQLGNAIDVDGNGVVSVSTDVVYISRRLLGLTPVPPSFRLSDSSIASDAVIAARVDALCPH
ncbi:MAG: hypothetical protein E6J56_10585 [Deltaproteobacteria bacterium]|nr:MAG: hypothetical protein E6J56_10585 [Deltaproteobacteria bacterium]